VNLDVTETILVPFFDFLYDTSLSVKTVYGKMLTLKVKAGTKPGTKFKISGKGRSQDGKTGDMFIIVDAKMPITPLEPNIEKMIEAIRYQI
jgi:DnaJ-class molecular chaperone